jgi:(E)-4-hydroxy-3-methylbut-2-enyl-diphosphate synthase
MLVSTAVRQYCNSLAVRQRLKTLEVKIGDVPVGGDNPIRVQSMTTTDTMDTAATVAQAIRMIHAGCEYIRITAPSLKEAENLKNIRAALHQQGYRTPLVADIHFTPNAAELAARIVEKVRINPGNYADKKKFEFIEYTDAEYNAELERIYKRFAPLVKICKTYGTAMRIGTNHGSLSDRIMSRYGDTPEGMVESAYEFIRICEDLGYYQLVISMKASNPQVMIQAYRLLVARMLASPSGRVYPLHLGVTEAGEGEDGRIKSAMGIGALLADGIGDTVRVSLTEPPEAEMPVARYLIRRAEKKHIPENHTTTLKSIEPEIIDYNPFSYSRRKTHPVFNIGLDNVPRVIATAKSIHETDLAAVGHLYDPALDKWHMNEQGADFIFLEKPCAFMLPNGLKAIYPAAVWQAQRDWDHSFPYFSSPAQYLEAENNSGRTSALLNFVSITDAHFEIEVLKKLAAAPVVLVFETIACANLMQVWRNWFHQLIAHQITSPVMLHYKTAPLIAETVPATATDLEKQIAASDLQETPANRYALSVAAELGALLSDGLSDGLWLEVLDNHNEVITTEAVHRTAFGILQAARMRITKTEYISCPSCGRTLFDLQETTAMIRSRTEHLKGVKIGIMGCIVNGPGEMADADYGYVGSGPGIITLYRGKEIVAPKISSELAVEKLIELIKEDGRWLEPVK